MVKEEECEGRHAGREEREGHKGEEEENVLFQQPLRRDRDLQALVMVLLIESGFAEEPRATLGCAGGKGHGLQHCIENNNKNNSQDKTRHTQHE